MKSSRQARVFYGNELAGYLQEREDGYVFEYDKEFLKKNIPVSISLPPREEPYKSKELFPFFKGLLPEGWYWILSVLPRKLIVKIHSVSCSQRRVQIPSVR